MAETVKENGRKRRPPSHLSQGYNQGNADPAKTLNSTRTDKTHSDSSSMFMMAKLLSKFISSANKKLNSERKTLIEHQSPLISCLAQNPKPSRSDNILNQQKKKSSKPYYSYSLLENEKIGKEINLSEIGLENKSKQSRGNTQISEAPQNLIMNNMMSVDSMSKMSREQFNRLIPKGINKKQETKISGSLNSKALRGLIKNQQSSADFKQDTKLFKRASFHVGIAYNIHIQNVKQKYPNFGPDELDPTFASRRLRQDNSGLIKKQNEEVEKLRKQQENILRQRMDEQAAFKLLQQNKRKQNEDKMQIERNKRKEEERISNKKVNQDEVKQNGYFGTRPLENSEREAIEGQTFPQNLKGKQSCHANNHIERNTQRQ